MLPVFQNLNNNSERRLYDVLPIQKSPKVSFLALGGLHEDKLRAILNVSKFPKIMKLYVGVPPFYFKLGSN